ncbi:MAG: FKBP-type peptidyl-prolyl cis-trans isomerase [Bacteroidia bacterium]|nr:FKBP-type peptidyl-prolyl cis-trans isomerase [Bacteroidia bacterium]
MKNIFYLLALIIVAYSCNSDGYVTDTSGMKYKFFVRNDNNKKPVVGDILVIKMKYTTEKDSVLFDTKEFNGQPFRMKMNAASKNGGTIDDAFALMHEGDSAEFVVDAERFFLETKNSAIPEFIKKGDKLVFNIKLVEIFSYDKFLEEKKAADLMTAEQEQKILESFIENANITVKPTSTGLYYIEDKAGKGSYPKVGQKVKVHYTGSFVSGEVFDSSLKRGEVFEFKFGEKEVIPGLEEGIGMMKKGGKATLIIPSGLAYGDQQFKMIQPFSTLIFEIELINIE